MTTELTYLAWTLVLALVYIGLPSQLRTLETGTAYNASARDAAGPPVGLYTGRLQRAQANLFETLPLDVDGTFRAGDSLRVVVDLTLTSPTGTAVQVDAEGRATGLVHHHDVVDLLEKRR